LGEFLAAAVWGHAVRDGLGGDGVGNAHRDVGQVWPRRQQRLVGVGEWGDASPRVAAATRIISSVTRVACAPVTASPMAGKM